MTVHLRTDEAELALQIIEQACLTGTWSCGAEMRGLKEMTMDIHLPFANEEMIELMTRTTRRLNPR